MASPTLATLNVAPSGSSPVGFVQQTWVIGGNPVTVYVQASTIFDGITGQTPTIDGNGLHVVPSYGTPNSSGPIANTNIASGGTATLTSPVPVTSGTTGSLEHAVFASTQPMLWTLQAVNNAGTPANVLQFITDANRSFDLKPGTSKEIQTVASTGASVVFQATAQNLSTNAATPGAAYCSFAWVEN